MRILATVVGASLAVVGTLLVAPTAHASESKRVSTAYDLSVPAGYALTRATVRFPSRRAFDLHGWVKDVCDGADGDGKGAYVRVVATRPDDSQYKREVGKDANGCGNGKRLYNPAPKKFDFRLRAVTVIICERDQDRPRRNAYCNLETFDNWRVD